MLDKIKNWTATKRTEEFDYIKALKTLAIDKTIEGYSLRDYLHFDFSNDEINSKFEAIDCLEQEYIESILELINTYSYYLIMNEKLESYTEKNIKTLHKINKLFDDDFVVFLGRYLDLDKTIMSSNESLKITKNYQNAIEYYLKHDFKFAINELNTFFIKKPRSDKISVKDDELTNSLLLKPKSKVYLKPLGKTGILKSLYFDLLYYFEDVNKEQSIDIIKEFFSATMQSKKSEHTLSVDTIKYIKKNKDKVYKEVKKHYLVEFDEDKNIIRKAPPKEIIEIKEIFNLQKVINDNFKPKLYISHK